MSWQGTEHVDLVRLGGRPTTKHVLDALGHRHDSRNGRIQFYVEEIAESTELGQSTVRRELKTLQQMGEIRELVRGNKSRQSVFEIARPLLRRIPLAGSRSPLAGSESPLAGSGSPLAPSVENDVIRKEEVEVKQEGSAAPLTVARKLLDAIRLPVTDYNKSLALAALDCEGIGRTSEEAFQCIVAGARKTVAAGGRVDGFWLQDAGWRDPYRKLSPEEARNQRTREGLEARAKKLPQAVSQ